MSKRMKVGTIVRLPERSATGIYAIAVSHTAGGVNFATDSGWEVLYGAGYASEFPVIGTLTVGKPYAVGTVGRRFRRTHLTVRNGTELRGPDVLVRADAYDSEETSIPAIRIQAFRQWVEAKQS